MVQTQQGDVSPVFFVNHNYDKLLFHGLMFISKLDEVLNNECRRNI